MRGFFGRSALIVCENRWYCEGKIVPGGDSPENERLTRFRPRTSNNLARPCGLTCCKWEESKDNSVNEAKAFVEYTTDDAMDDDEEEVDDDVVDNDALTTDVNA